MNKVLRHIAGCLLLGQLAAIVTALPGDNQQPVNIKANRATQQSLTEGEKTEYFGDVVMTQGSMLVNAEHLIIHSVDRQVIRITAEGNPARFQQQSDPDKSPVKASANNIDYRLTTETVVLTENAHIDQPEAAFSGNRIEYNIATEEVVAEEGVNMIFTPANKAKAQAAGQQPDKEQHDDAAGQ